MKKLSASLMTAALVVALVGCGSKNDSSESTVQGGLNKTPNVVTSEDQEKVDNTDTQTPDAGIVEEDPNKIDIGLSLGDVTAPEFEEGSIVGTWVSKFSLGNFVDTSTFPQEIVSNMANVRIEFDCTWNFYADNTLYVEIDEKSLLESYDKWINAYLEACEDYFTSYYAALGTSLQEVMQASGFTSFREAVDLSGLSAQREQMAEQARTSFNRDGKYKTEDGKLYITSTDEFTEDYFTYCFNNKDLVFTGTSKGDPFGFIPMTLKRK